MKAIKTFTLYFFSICAIFSCSEKKKVTETIDRQKVQALVFTDYTADPSAHIFNNKIFIYPSHDIESGVPEDDLGGHFDMKDYHVYSMDSVRGEVTDHGVALDIKNIPWAGRQLWAPDAALKNNQYYFYFPAKDKQDIFRIGVAVADKPEGPFTAEPLPIEGSYSMDPAVFQDNDGKFYLYFGGLWGGQLQNWQTGNYVKDAKEPLDDTPAIGPRVALMTDDMLGFAEPVKEIMILDETGKPIAGKDNKRRFFEAAWMHQYNGLYYLSYSTGDTHFICYATGKSPYGPFTYQGIILMPVVGWTNHHSIVDHNGQWYLFFHDSGLSRKTHLRNIKATKLQHLDGGRIQTIEVIEK